MRSHLMPEGTWATCEDASCSLPFHLDLSEAAARAIPMELIYPLMEAFDPPTEVDTEGNKRWKDSSGREARSYDLPAAIDGDGGFHWLVDGMHHRDGDKPAYIMHDGTQLWYEHGKIHRAGDKPAVIYPNGNKLWYTNDLRHRENDLPAETFANGYQAWWHDGHLHRDGDKPGGSRVSATGATTVQLGFRLPATGYGSSITGCIASMGPPLSDPTGK